MAVEEMSQSREKKFYVQIASEQNRSRVLEIIKDILKPNQTVSVGVIDPINNRLETRAEVKYKILDAADFIPVGQFETTDDCGFSPFGDDISTARETAFEKFRSRIEGTKLVSAILKV
jgi:5-methyltetrahydropteroyltriglutamate--homocysteine methyltransferase